MYICMYVCMDLGFAEWLVEVDGLCESDGVGDGGLHQVFHAGEADRLQHLHLVRVTRPCMYVYMYVEYVCMYVCVCLGVVSFFELHHECDKSMRSEVRVRFPVPTCMYVCMCLADELLKLQYCMYVCMEVVP